MLKQTTQAGLVCLSLFLGGCVSQPNSPTQPATTPSDAQAAWKQRQAQFAKMRVWRLQGRVGIQFSDQSASFGLSWLQTGKDNYEMNIKNPLTGSILAHLQGSANEVTLKANNKTYKDANAERLLQGQLGVSLPLDGMKYWVRGIPDPKAAVEAVKLDEQGRPESLQQAGWKISYSGWQGANWQALPRKINLTRVQANTKVKVIAKDWQTRF